MVVMCVSFNQMGKEVEVMVLSPATGDQRSFMVVYDNGCGMTKETLDAYFTYYYGQKERGLDPQALRQQQQQRKEQIQQQGIFHPHLSFTISKFGVGALESVFFLADRVKVITKAKGEEQVRSFELGEARLNAKAQDEGRENVYKGQNLVHHR